MTAKLHDQLRSLQRADERCCLRSMTELAFQNHSSSNKRHVFAMVESTTAIGLIDARMRVVAFLAKECGRDASTENELGEVDEN